MCQYGDITYFSSQCQQCLHISLNIKPTFPHVRGSVTSRSYLSRLSHSPLPIIPLTIGPGSWSESTMHKLLLISGSFYSCLHYGQSLISNNYTQQTIILPFPIITHKHSCSFFSYHSDYSLHVGFFLHSTRCKYLGITKGRKCNFLS